MSCLCNKEYFKLSDFVIDPATDVPVRIMNAIYEFHFKPMNEVRRYVGAPVFISHNSCWRPEQWEWSKGRSGDSAHTFKVTDRPGNEKGACDSYSQDMKGLFEGLIKKTKYTRITYYPDSGFIHKDYCYPESGRRFFIHKHGKWHQSTENEIRELL